MVVSPDELSKASCYARVRETLAGLLAVPSGREHILLLCRFMDPEMVEAYLHLLERGLLLPPIRPTTDLKRSIASMIAFHPAKRPGDGDELATTLRRGSIVLSMTPDSRVERKVKSTLSVLLAVYVELAEVGGPRKSHYSSRWRFGAGTCSRCLRFDCVLCCRPPDLLLTLAALVAERIKRPADALLGNYVSQIGETPRACEIVGAWMRRRERHQMLPLSIGSGGRLGRYVSDVLAMLAFLPAGGSEPAGRFNRADGDASIRARVREMLVG